MQVGQGKCKNASYRWILIGRPRLNTCISAYVHDTPLSTEYVPFDNNQPGNNHIREIFCKKRPTYHNTCSKFNGLNSIKGKQIKELLSHLETKLIER
jgi:hypothetical protein